MKIVPGGTLLPGGVFKRDKPTAPEPAPDARELARELVARIILHSLTANMEREVEQALATAYRAGIEAAARLMETHGLGPEESYPRRDRALHVLGNEQRAAAIRALVP